MVNVRRPCAETEVEGTLRLVVADEDRESIAELLAGVLVATLEDGEAAEGGRR